MHQAQAQNVGLLDLCVHVSWLMCCHPELLTHGTPKVRFETQLKVRPLPSILILMLSAVLNAVQLVKVDDLSDDDPGAACVKGGPDNDPGAACAKGGPDNKTVGPSSKHDTVKSKPSKKHTVCKKPASKTTNMKRPATSTQPLVEPEKPQIRAWKYKYHKHNKYGIKVQVGQGKIAEVLTVPGTTNFSK